MAARFSRGELGLAMYMHRVWMVVALGISALSEMMRVRTSAESGTNAVLTLHNTLKHASEVADECLRVEIAGAVSTQSR